MRLVCPNCDAKYEVPDDAIPQGGRDVQCSSCGHAWFQLHPEAEVAAEEEAALFGDDLVRPEEPALEGPEPEREPVKGGEADPDPHTADAIAALVAEAGPAVATDATPPKQELDETVLAVLREEAAREAEARRIDAQRDGARRAEAEGQLQVQPDLGVETPPPAALSPTQRRLAMLKGKDPDAPPPEPPKPAARRDLLPDVEEINSTLQPSESSYDPDAEVDKLPDLTRRGGFRSGFFLMILLMVIAAAIYLSAPKLVAQFPALEGTLTAYVSMIDSLRLWLNNLVNSATNALNGGSEGG